MHVFRFKVVVDDSFISFRVARHWFELGIPVYNPGNREWVPTSFLWVALLAGFDRQVSMPLPLLAQVLGGIAGMATVVLLGFGFPSLGAAGALAALWCACSSLWAAWPLSGM